jgi:peptidoglycan/LPS O-acetylase OafA/YrhL
MVSLDLHDGGILAREEIPSSDVVRERFGYLDGLRMLAILAVLVAEVAKHTNLMARARPEVAAAYRACSHGLDLFFVISGFALAYPILTLVHQEGQTYLDVARYALKRILRIVPTYYVAIALTVLVPLLALHLQLGALQGPIPSRPDIIRQALFLGNTIPNDGFWSLLVTMRWYVLFPFLVLLWVRLPIAFYVVGAALWVLNFFTPAHSLGLGMLPAFMLGILAADVRAQRARIERFALPLALVVGAAAVYLEPAFAAVPGASGQPSIYTINPVWQVALFLLLVGVGFFGVIERLFGLRIFGFFAAASYAISLVADPVTGFMSRRLALQQIGPEGAAANAGAIAIIMGVILWQLIDRWFSDGNLRQRLVDSFAPVLRTGLSLVRAANVYYAGRGRLRTIPRADTPEQEEQPQTTGFYAPPPRGSGDLAVVMQRTGSPEQLAAEILETKKRLAEQSAALFADPEPEPVVPPREPERSPGFYEHGQRAAPLDAPASIDADPFIAPQSPQRPSASPSFQPPATTTRQLPPPGPAPSYAPAAAAPPPSYAPPPPDPLPPPQPHETVIGGYALSQPPTSNAPGLEGWLIPKSFDDDFARATAAPEPPSAPELPGWIHSVEPGAPPDQRPSTQSSLPTQPAAWERPLSPPPPPPPVTPPSIRTSISLSPSQPRAIGPATSQPASAQPQPPSAMPPEQAPPISRPPIPQAPISAAPPISPPPISPPPISQAPISQPPIAQRPPIPVPAVSQPPPVSPPAAMPPAIRATISQAPISQPPISQPPISQPPISQAPISQAPIAMPPAASAPIPQPPIPQPPTSQPPISQTPSFQPPAPIARPAAAASAVPQLPAQPPPPATSTPPAAYVPPPSAPIAMPQPAPEQPPFVQQAYQEPSYQQPAYTPPAYTPPLSPISAAPPEPPAVTPPEVPAASAAAQAPSPQPPAPAQATPLPLQTSPLPLVPAASAAPPPSVLGLPAYPAPPPPPSFRESQEAPAASAVRGGGDAEQQESSSPPSPGNPSIPGQRVTISLRPARPPIKVRIGPSPLSAPTQTALSSNGKHALDDVIDG